MLPSVTLPACLWCFVLAGCNVTDQATDEVEVGFRYVVIDLP